MNCSAGHITTAQFFKLIVNQRFLICKWSNDPDIFIRVLFYVICNLLGFTWSCVLNRRFGIFDIYKC